jgi:hypothetical protein
MFQKLIRWAMVVFAVLGTFFGLGIATLFVADFFGLLVKPVSGFVAAFAVVLVTYLTAPSHRMTAAIVVLVLGAIISWDLLEPSFYSEPYPGKQYQTTHIPIIMTWLGGALGLGLSFTLNKFFPGQDVMGELEVIEAIKEKRSL